jgi:hypothetical protein
MKYNCECCKYATDNKSNFNKHLKSATHNRKNNNKKTVNPKSTLNVDHKSTKIKQKKLICHDCGGKFGYRQSLSRHKLNSCPNKNKQEETEELREEITILKSEIGKLVELVSNSKMITNINNTYNISVKNYIQQNYPNAPALKGINDYSKLTYKDYKLLDTLIYHHNNNNLHKYLGNFIIAHYKKDNPAEQSIWSSDTSRLTYIISELLSNKKSVWNHDYKGTKVKEYILKPFLEYIRDYISDYFANIEVKKNKYDDIMKIERECKYRLNVANIAELIDNNSLIDEIIRYIAPYFCIDKDKDRLNIMKQIEHFVDK